MTGHHVQESDHLLPVSKPASSSAVLLFLALVDLLAGCGLSQAFKNFMQDRLGFSLVATSSLRSTAACLGNLAPLLGAFIGDECWGPFRTTEVFGGWYVVTMTVLAATAHPTLLNDHLPWSTGLFLAVLFVGLPIANGCFSSNLVILGADQLAAASTTDKQLYFSRFYLLRNAGSIVAFTYLASLSVNGMAPWIPAEYGYFANYTLCTALVAVALALFYHHSPQYIRRPPVKGAFTGFFASLYASTSVCPDLWGVVGGVAALLSSFLFNVAAIFCAPGSSLSHGLTIGAGGLVLLGAFLWVLKGRNPSYLDAHPTLSRAEVADMKQVVRTLPFASFLIVWLVLYDQFDSNYQAVTQQTDLRLGPGRDATQVPGSMLCLFDPLGLVILLPLLDHVIFPRIARSRQGKAPTAYEKVLAGLCFGVVNMLWTAQVEVWRRESGLINVGDGRGPVLDGGSHQPMNNLPWTYMIPTYLLHSLCESLIQVTAIDVFYTHVPAQLKCTAQATRAFMGAMGENVASLFVLGFARFIPDNINDGHMEYMYYTLAVATFGNAVGFAYVMRQMHFATDDDDDRVAVRAQNQIQVDV